MPKSEKGDNSVKYLQNSAKSLSDHLHLGHNCEPNIMILAQAVLEIVCLQGSIGLQWDSQKKH